MKMIEFLKNYAGLTDGDLAYLLAFKKGWKLTVGEFSKEVKKNVGSSWKLLESYNAKGLCRKERIPVRKSKVSGKDIYKNVYIFNSVAQRITKEIFEKKILPKYPITPEDFLKNDEIDVIFQIK